MWDLCGQSGARTGFPPSIFGFPLSIIIPTNATSSSGYQAGDGQWTHHRKQFHRDMVPTEVNKKSNSFVLKWSDKSQIKRCSITSADKHRKLALSLCSRGRWNGTPASYSGGSKLSLKGGYRDLFLVFVVAPVKRWVTSTHDHKISL